ncbi:PadR family transcriptional regulator [Paenibacillus alvei]|uniref:PadR family transcriptional regulator n=1 Tax=Paenibacillus alvei TaxID=44250 RepID=UPI00227E5F9C|nr:PadR family transcriptional regulator [Paenibacillus alvei]
MIANGCRFMKEEVEHMSMKLAILGLLMEQDRHPYEMSQAMKEREMHNYMKIQYGSLYYAIDQLNKGEFIEKAEFVSGGSRPDKTIYRITEKGKRELEELLIEEMKKLPHLNHPFYAALSFVKYADQSIVMEIIQNRISYYEQEAERMWALYEEHISYAPRSVLYMLYGGYKYTVTELNWLKSLHEDALAGKLGSKGEPLPVQKLH